MTDTTGMSAEGKRHDQLTSAPEATERDVEPRIQVHKRDGVTRIDVDPGADVRPGSDPAVDPAATATEEER